MDELERFRGELKARLRASASAPGWSLAEIDDAMTAFQSRHEQFQDRARSLIEQVIKPRLDALLELFSSARTDCDEEMFRYSCWFAASDRFPVTAKLEFSIGHNESLDRLFVCCEAALMPTFFQFQPHDRLTLELEGADPQRIAAWVEKRIGEFLESYLRYDRGADDLEEDIVTDPVCGMRLSRSQVHETSTYRGHLYFFCSAECRNRLEKDATQFVRFSTI